MPKAFASAADLADKQTVLEEAAEGVYTLTAEGDPNVSAIVGPDAVLCVDARATPTHASEWLEQLRQLTDKPVEWLLLTHYHAVRVLGASAFGARHIVAHENTNRWIHERGAADWESEYRRFPRLFKDAESIPGLTHPDVTFGDRLTVFLGEREVQIVHLGGGHTIGDAAVWLPTDRVLIAGDLVEAQAAPYMGDASIEEWTSETLPRIERLEPRVLVPGRGPVVRGDDVRGCLAEMRGYTATLWETVRASRERGTSLKQAFDEARAALEPRFGGWAIFEHCLPFNVARAWDEAGGLPQQVWTADKDAEVWEQLQS
jgi:glyoxylase-like metal-dependent hydrolase (beta-lactamase superfamily II)